MDSQPVARLCMQLFSHAAATLSMGACNLTAYTISVSSAVARPYALASSVDVDPLSVTASIIAVLQLSVKVLAYLSDVKDALKDRTHCKAGISNLYRLLCNLRDHVQKGDPSQP